MAAPWDAAPADEQLFVLVTGANSGIGLATCERLTDEFLLTRPLTAHLVLLPTTRSASKALDTIAHLRKHASQFAHTSSALRNRYTDKAYTPQSAVERIHVLSPQVDLCDVRGIRDVAERLCNEDFGNPKGLEGEYLHKVRVPRIDVVVCNAGMGGWSGFSLPSVLWQMATQGIPRAMTWPRCKIPMPTRYLNNQPGYNYPAKPLLGEVFCACIFGHYLLIHDLLPLLNRSSPSEQPARVIWSSSIEAVETALDPSDPQALVNPIAYESAKRLTDVLSLTCSLPSSSPHSRTWLTPSDKQVAEDKPCPPKVYLSHPGIVASTLMPVPWFLFWAYKVAVVIARWLGSPWHGGTSYSGASAACHLALEPQSSLDAASAERVKWGSACDAKRRDVVKPTEVDGWGWEGKPVDEEAVRSDTAEGIMHMSVGRHGKRETTEEDVRRFEEVGKGLWGEMERLRGVWEEIAEKSMLAEQINGKH